MVCRCVNLHPYTPDGSSLHAQHRDIYGVEQRDFAGPDCTCSFKPNVATACVSLGSDRQCLVKVGPPTIGPDWPRGATNRHSALVQ